MTVPEDRDGRISARTAAILLFAFGIGIFGGYILFGSVESWIGKAAEAFIVAIAPSTIGLTIWRLEGHPLTTIATWTLPLLAATAVSIYALTGLASTVLYLACVAVLAAMILTRSAPLAWRRLLRL